MTLRLPVRRHPDHGAPPLGNGTDAQVQVASWYDNENSYASQMVRTIKYFEKFVA